MPTVSAVTESQLDWCRFGEYIAGRRDRQAMTQGDLAKAIGRHQPFISSLEAGKVQPTIETAFRLADALDVDPARLIAALR